MDIVAQVLSKCMKQAINTAIDGVAFAIRAGYEHHVYMGSLRGGGHFPKTCVIEIYEECSNRMGKR